MGCKNNKFITFTCCKVNIFYNRMHKTKSRIIKKKDLKVDFALWLHFNPPDKFLSEYILMNGNFPTV
jgi:hypothetical protein